MTDDDDGEWVPDESTFETHGDVPQTEFDRLRTMRAELTAFCNAVEADGEHRTFLLAGVRNIIRKTDS